MLWTCTFIMLLGLPLIGVVLTGKDVLTYLEFPPLTRYVVQAGFSWWIFAVSAAIDLTLVIMIVRMLISAHQRSRPAKAGKALPFPSWGWIGVAIMLGGWLLAWTRFSWFAVLQRHTFCLPWIGYILFINALCVKRNGQSLLTDTPTRFLLLFPVSALFWWFFEYLNRFVQNWYYIEVEMFGPLAYTSMATLAFATVLPAVLSTHRLLLTFATFDQGLKHQRPLRVAHTRTLAIATLLICSFGLALLGVYPDLLFALVWLAPLLIIAALQAMAGRHTIFSPLKRGDWRSIIASALAALICGFFWEMWNVGSLAGWVYAIAYVDRFHIFAMPLLGYGGYLPFGLECLIIGQIVLGNRRLCIASYHGS